MTEPRSRVLGVDVGAARIGLALSDPSGVLAQPLETVERVGPRKDLQRIAERVRRHEVGLVVVGLPLLLSGAEGRQALAAREFAEGLRRRIAGVPVELWDERLTTAQAERTMVAGKVRRSRRRRVIDSLAAVLILQSFLDARGAAP